MRPVISARFVPSSFLSCQMWITWTESVDSICPISNLDHPSDDSWSTVISRKKCASLCMKQNMIEVEEKSLSESTRKRERN